MSEEKKFLHVKAFEGQTFIISVLVSVFSAVICMQIISRIGTTPNTSVIGALFAMALARIPFASLSRFRSLDRQNLVQTMASAAGFGAANCCLLAVGILYVFGDPSLIVPMLVGSGMATLIGMHLRPVVVPLRISLKQIGEAQLICARTRPKFVGGSRAVYDEALL